MSLINQMLKDLDKRNATVGGVQVQPMSGEVRSVVSESSTYKLLPLLLVAVFISAGALAWQKFLKPATKPLVPAPQVLVLATPAVAVNPTPAVVITSEPAAVQSLQASENSAPALPVSVNSTPMLENKLPPLVAVNEIDSAKVKNVAVKIDSTSSSEVIVPTKKLIEPAEKVVLQSTEEKNRENPEKITNKPSRESALKIVSPQQAADNAYRQAISLIQQGLMADAKQSLQLTLNYNPLNINARQLLVGLLVEDGQQSEAITLLQDGLKITPDHSQFSFDLARLQVETGDPKFALDTLESGLSMAGNNPQFHALLGTLLQGEERHDEAVEHYLTALKADPAMPNWLIGIGISLQAQGKLDDAMKAFKRAQASGVLSSELTQFVDQRLKQLEQ